MKKLHWRNANFTEWCENKVGKRDRIRTSLLGCWVSRSHLSQSIC
ncbi:MAG: hypothetical protein ACOCXU_07185 [Coleofasciculus sp.]